jgi:hypothetical protein
MALLDLQGMVSENAAGAAASSLSLLCAPSHASYILCL